MANDDLNQDMAEMSFWDHLDVLRSILFKIGGIIVVLAIVLFCLMPQIFDNVILAPCSSDFVVYKLMSAAKGAIPGAEQFAGDDFHVDLINIQLASQFFIHMSTSFWLALVLAFPIVIYLLWGFVSPALYEHEKRHARFAFLFGNLMFYLGLAVGYFSVFPMALRFLAGYHVSELVPNTISLDSYMDTFIMLIFIMGVVFELPLLAWILSSIGLLRRSFFHRYRRHAVVAILVIAALITPTSDPFTLFVVFVPVYILYEMSALLVKKESPEELEDAAD